MVALLRARGIASEAVLDAFLRVPRHLFVPEIAAGFAYTDGPLDIGFGQTISQPYMVAAMTEALDLKGGERVLEVGTGSGYQCALLAELAGEVISIERVPELAEAARARLADAGYDNVTILTGDGTRGVKGAVVPADLPPGTRFDAIMVTAGAPEAPAPLLALLAEGGRLVIPEGSRGLQTLMRYTRTDGKLRRERLMDCMFVPLIGAFGWDG